MRLKTIQKRDRGDLVISLIFAILILVIGGIIIYQLARCIKNIFPKTPQNPTNSVSFYYQTGYESQVQAQIPEIKFSPAINSPVQNVPAESTFTFTYRICPAGMGTVITDNTNEYEFLLNLGTNWFVYDFNLQTGVENDYTNPVLNAAIQKTTNFMDWINMATNTGIDPGTIYSFTDTNAVENAAFYRVIPAVQQ